MSDITTITESRPEPWDEIIEETLALFRLRTWDGSHTGEDAL